MEPYPKPIILNHDLNSEPIGRVMAAKMDKEQDGGSFVRLQIAITDPVAIQKVLDKRYLTGSVGGRAGKAICSISGDDLASESAGKPPAARYKRGQVYKGKLAFIDMQDISFKEYSFVNQPADSKSSVRSVQSPGSDTVPTSDSEWIARSSAFILSMNEENIYSLEENESILEPLKKKESKPLYLHLKGSFLSAMAIHESENYINSNESLLSNENESDTTHREKSNMKDDVQQDDVLTAVEELSQDLSTIASGVDEPKEEADAPEENAAAEEDKTSKEPEAKEEIPSAASKVQQVLQDILVKNTMLNETILAAIATCDEANDKDASDLLTSLSDVHKKWSWQLRFSLGEDAGEPADESWRITKSPVAEEKQEELEKVDSENSTEAEENKEVEQSDAQLTGTKEASEQKAKDADEKVQLLEEENKKLKNALHRTLAERVVDAKIAAGIEAIESRESLMEDHAKRSASSLADSLRDIAKMPTAKAAKAAVPEIDSEVEVIEGEENAITIDKEKEEVSQERSAEQVFVDALMGRIKL